MIMCLSTWMTIFLCGGMILFGFLLYTCQLKIKEKELCSSCVAEMGSYDKVEQNDEDSESLAPYESQ